jgi:hypothetical protein
MKLMAAKVCKVEQSLQKYHIDTETFFEKKVAVYAIGLSNTNPHCKTNGESYT